MAHQEIEWIKRALKIPESLMTTGLQGFRKGVEFGSSLAPND